MSDEKQCPLKSGQSVTACAEERCAWWDSVNCVPQCALLSAANALGSIARRMGRAVQKPPGEDE